MVSPPPNPVQGRAPCLHLVVYCGQLFMWQLPGPAYSEVSVYQPGLLTYLHLDPLHISWCRQEEAVIAGLLHRE